MIDTLPDRLPGQHSHVFLAAEHARSERATWVVITLCAGMMAAEVVGGLLFGSIALVADGLHMSTHAGALLLAAVAYRYARTHANDPRFSFGTGKLGDLAGFSSAVILALIAVLIGCESIGRVLHPVAIHFAEAIPIACLGLTVNIISAWLLSGSGEDRHDHDRANQGAHHDNNIRAAIVHVAADAAVSLLVIVGLVLARAFGWLWMDPLAGIVGAGVIASWSYGLLRDTAAILLDMNPDAKLTEDVRSTIESDGDRLADLHLWRVGPGHLAAIVCVITDQPRRTHYYRERLARHKLLSHLTVEIIQPT